MCYYCATGEAKPSESDKPSASHFSGNNCHIEFLSGDQDENAFNAYFASMPWVATAGYNRETYQKKMGTYGIRGIPTLVLLKGDGTMASKDCRGDVMGCFGQDGKPDVTKVNAVIEKWKGLAK